MALVKEINFYGVVELRDMVREITLNRGNGRRAARSLRSGARIPEKVNVSNTDVTHEIVLRGKGRMQYCVPKGKAPSPNPKHDYCLVALFGSTAGLPRPSRTKALFYGDSWYYVYTWTDIFGAPVRESALEVFENNNSILLLKKADEESAGIINEAMKPHI